VKDVDLYSFVYRGVLTEEALDRVGRRRRNHFGAEEARSIQKSLSFDFLDADLLTEAQRMSLVYAAIHAFENTVRTLVTKAMAEKHGEGWWDKPSFGGTGRAAQPRSTTVILGILRR
jgi:hypothetical protein